MDEHRLHGGDALCCAALCLRAAGGRRDLSALSGNLLLRRSLLYIGPALTSTLPKPVVPLTSRRPRARPAADLDAPPRHPSLLLGASRLLKSTNVGGAVLGARGGGANKVR